MKKLLALCLLLSGCAGTSVKSECDVVQNRERVYVCGKATVVKNCDPVPNRGGQFVCDSL